MDSYIQSLYSMLPTVWQPYVVLFLLVAYVVTKWRSNAKNEKISPMSKDIRPIGIFGKIVDFMF